MLRKLLLHVEVAFYFSLKMHLNSSFSSFLSSRAVAGIKGVGMIKNGFNAHVIMWKKEDLKKRAQHHHKKWLLSFSYWIPWWLGDSGSQYRVILELLTFGYDLQKKGSESSCFSIFKKREIRLIFHAQSQQWLVRSNSDILPLTAYHTEAEFYFSYRN